MKEETRTTLDLGALFLRYREEGDMTSFQAIMDELHTPIFNYLLRLLFNRDDAEDALQEVWMKVIRQRDNYNDQGKFSSWVYRIAHNHCLDHFRKRKRCMEDSENYGDEGVSVIERTETDQPSPLEVLLEQEQLGVLEKAVAELPEAIREVYVLRAVHDVPFKEIAEIQDAPLGTVLSRMHQAVNRLKKVIAFDAPPAQEIV